jgi:hypothetical protein
MFSSRRSPIHGSSIQGPPITSQQPSNVRPNSSAASGPQKRSSSTKKQNQELPSSIRDRHSVNSPLSKDVPRTRSSNNDTVKSNAANSMRRTSSAQRAAIPSTSARILQEIPMNNQTSGHPPKTSRSTTNRRRVPPTDPNRTNQLWQRVRGTMDARYLKPTAASQQRAKSKGKNAAPDDYCTPPQSYSPQSTTSRTSSGTAETKKARMRDSDFRTTVLDPRDILFPSERLKTDVFAHFGTALPFNDITAYKDLEGCGHTEVWLTADNRFIGDVNREYFYMNHEKLCEAEFATYAKETLLQWDPRFLEHKEDREWRTERMVELSTKSGSVDPHGQWLGPPVTKKNSDSKEFDFDIRPDCQYWLSVRAFNPKYTQLFTDYVFVRRRRITCPYFTIEFKKDDGSIPKAENQVATAAAVALYNRCRLKQDRLVQTRKRWTQKHNTSLCHYGLTFAGSSYQFWWIRLRQDADKRSISPKKWTWPGCEMVKARDGNLELFEDTRTFIDWVNEIHRWGLSVHGPSCEKDVKFCVAHANTTVRTSLGNPEEAAEQDSDTEVDDK